MQVFAVVVVVMTMFTMVWTAMFPYLGMEA
jgi:hypothetical protein